MARTKVIKLAEQAILSKRPAPLRAQTKSEFALDESPRDDQLPQVEPQPSQKQRITLEDATALAREEQKKKREQKLAEKEEKKSKVAENRAKAPNNAKALLDELNAIASIDADKEPKYDENGIEENNYFYLQHREEDIDCMGDLETIKVRDVKAMMRFDKDCLQIASNLKMLQTKDSICGKKIAGTRTI